MAIRAVSVGLQTQGPNLHIDSLFRLLLRDWTFSDPFFAPVTSDTGLLLGHESSWVTSPYILR